MASPEPFRAYRAVQKTYDARMARLLERTAKAIRARIAKLPVGVGGDVRRAQLTLVLNEIDKIIRASYNGPMLDTIHAGRRAGAVAAESAAETLTAVVYTALPEAVAEAVTRGLRASALSGIESAFARIPRELSTRVYRNSTIAIKQVHELIDQGLAAGLSARELAASVYKHISPTTPGGASYAAMRLARTEINNAFHERQIIAGERPGVTGCKWNLSGSHKVPDECNLFAQRNSHDLGRGVYPVGLVPDRPHPQCFCFLTYVTMTPKQFAAALDNGEFDDELDRRTKANLARLQSG